MSAATILFPFGMRLTTWACVVAFVALAVRRRDWRPLAAGWAWLLGFEAAFNVTRWATGYGFQPSRVLPMIVGAFTIVWFAWHGLRPSLGWIFVTGLIWIVWIAAGFPANQHALSDWSWPAEVLNVSAKTAWAAACFWPLREPAGRRLRELVPGAESEQALVAADA